MTELDSELQVRIGRLEARERQRGSRTRLFIAFGIASVMATPFAVRALGAVPHVFSSGDPIVAAEINENFSHVASGVTAVEARATSLEARPTGLYCGSPYSNGAFRSGDLRGYPAARELCRIACDGSPTAHLCSGDEAATSLQMGLLPLDTAGWVAGGDNTTACGVPAWTRGDVTSIYGLALNTQVISGDILGTVGRADCNMVRPLFCCN